MTEQNGSRPVLNNKELTNRALMTILAPLQDYVISEMKYNFGQGWWADKVIPDRILYNIPQFAPSSGDVSDSDVRSYMDVMLCIKLIHKFKLLPPALHRMARDPMSYVMDLRNNLSHAGDTDYPEYQAQDGIRLMAILDEMLDLGCKDDLEALMAATRMPMADAPSHVKDERKSAPKNVKTAAPPAPPKFPPRAPVKTLDGIGDICVMSCRGMLDALLEKQTERRDTSRFTSRVENAVLKGDHYFLRLQRPMVVDDSLSFMVGDREFTGTQVSFDRYNSAAKTINMYPGEELKGLMDPIPNDMQVFTDMKWLTEKTRDFFSSFGHLISFPKVPLSYTPGIILRDMSMSDEQKAAVSMAMSEPLSYVWGVPGSGKTQSVLAASVAECVSRGERVAVIAPTNLALEQVLRGLMKAFEGNEEFKKIIDPSRDIIRIGTPTLGFATEFSGICESRGVQKQFVGKKQQFDHISNVLLERRYDELRGICDECAAAAPKVKENDVSGRAALMKKMAPLLDAMMKDERFRLNASRVSQSNICDNIPRIRKLIYERDRSEFFEGDISARSGEDLEAWMSELSAQMHSLNPYNRPTDPGSYKIVAMTLSKFIVSFGPESGEGRTGLHVDHVFVDEAGYCNAVQTMALFTLGAPVTMLGDHMQLPPVCELDHTDLINSIVEEGDRRFNYLWDLSALYVDHFFDGDMVNMRVMYTQSSEPDFVRIAHSDLRTTYRFGPNLAEVLGRHVYPQGMSSASDDPLEVVIIDAHIDEFPIRGGKVRRENSAEADAVLKVAKKLSEEDFVILTPYKDQIRCLEDRDPRLKDNLLTIHKSQGREWDTVIISVCDGRANPEDKPPRFTSSRMIEGAFIGLKVINTALSRAKKKLIVVCDAEHWAAQKGELLGDLVSSYRG